jgi:hypothetical protein
MDDLFSSLFTLFNEGAVKKHHTHPRKMQATALSKRTVGSICFVTFEMPDGKHIEMGVSKQDFDCLNDNDRCELIIENGQCTEIDRI